MNKQTLYMTKSRVTPKNTLQLKLTKHSTQKTPGDQHPKVPKILGCWSAQLERLLWNPQGMIVISPNKRDKRNRRVVRCCCQNGVSCDNLRWLCSSCNRWYMAIAIETCDQRLLQGCSCKSAMASRLVKFSVLLCYQVKKNEGK